MPPTPDPTSSSSLPQPKSCKSVQRHLTGKPQRRSAESCRSGNSYTRERFHPGPTRTSCFFVLTEAFVIIIIATVVFSFISSIFSHFTQGDLEEEKRRLQNILSNGQDKPPSATNTAYHNPEVSEDRDRYQEGKPDCRLMKNCKYCCNSIHW